MEKLHNNTFLLEKPHKLQTYCRNTIHNAAHTITWNTEIKSIIQLEKLSNLIRCLSGIHFTYKTQTTYKFSKQFRSNRNFTLSAIIQS